MNLPLPPGGERAKPALELIDLARMSPEIARQSLRTLLIANPSYFSKVTDEAFRAVLRIQHETTYESIAYVAYSQSFEQLQTAVNICGSIGYSDEDSTSSEFVRFYLSYDGGMSWVDQGMSSVNVRNRRRSGPQQEMLAVGITTAPRVCLRERVLLVRVILSWNAPPPEGAPDWIPAWGDVFTTLIDLEHIDGLPLYNRCSGAAEPEPDASLN
jgi:hypothetical protein